MPSLDVDFTLRAYNFLTSAEIIFNATIANSTTTILTPNLKGYTNFTSEIPLGALTINLFNASYYPARILINNNFSLQVLNAYLLPIDNPLNIFVRLHVNNPQGGQITGALITVSYSGNLITQAYTDSAGIVSFYLDSSKAYTIVSTYPGLTDLTTSIVPVTNDYYITMGNTGETTFAYTFSNLTWSLAPNPRGLYINLSVINFTIYSLDSKLEWYGLAITYNNSLIFNQSNTTPATGGIILVEINLTNRAGFVFAHPYFKKVGFLEYYDNSAPFWIEGNQTKQITNNTGVLGTLIATKADLNLGNNFGIILIFIGMLLTAVLTKRMGIAGGAVGVLFLAFIGLFGVFTPANITPDNPLYWGVYVFILLVSIAIVFIRWGGI
jgi:hypothetical protein